MTKSVSEKMQGCFETEIGFVLAVKLERIFHKNKRLIASLINKLEHYI